MPKGINGTRLSIHALDDRIQQSNVEFIVKIEQRVGIVKRQIRHGAVDYALILHWYKQKHKAHCDYSHTLSRTQSHKKLRRLERSALMIRDLQQLYYSHTIHIYYA